MSDFFFKDTATTEIYTYCHTLSLHDALPICWTRADIERWSDLFARYFYAQGLRPGDIYQIMVGYAWFVGGMGITQGVHRSEEHTSELQSLMRISYAVFCLKKNKRTSTHATPINKI